MHWTERGEEAEEAWEEHKGMRAEASIASCRTPMANQALPGGMPLQILNMIAAPVGVTSEEGRMDRLHKCMFVFNSCYCKALQ